MRVRREQSGDAERHKVKLIEAVTISGEFAISGSSCTFEVDVDVSAKGHQTQSKSVTIEGEATDSELSFCAGTGSRKEMRGTAYESNSRPGSG